MNRLRTFYFAVRIEIAFVILVYVWIRLARFEFQSGDQLYVFDRWTTKVDRARVTQEPFVEEPATRINFQP